MLVLWNEYERLKKKKLGYTDNDVFILMYYIESLLETNKILGDKFKTSIDSIESLKDRIESLKDRIEFYRHVTCIKKVIDNGRCTEREDNKES